LTVCNQAPARISPALPPDNATGNFIKIVQCVPVKILFDPESVKADALSRTSRCATHDSAPSTCILDLTGLILDRHGRSSLSKS
jgi:multidrug resistance efflux pump